MGEKRILNTFLLISFLILGLYILYTNLTNGYLFNPPLLLASAFLQGRLDISPFALDMVPFGGKTYWHEGPFPSLILTPLAFIFKTVSFNFGLVPFFFNILIFLVLLKLASKILKCSNFEALWWVFLYFFGSVFIGISFEGVVWYYYQLVATLLVALALLEYFGKKRPLVMGLFLSLAVSTRLFAILGVLFFAIAIFFSKGYLKEKMIDILKLGTPIFLVLIILGWYNFARFGNVFETGYGINIHELPSVRLSRDEGLFNIGNMPTNFYWYFLKGPEGFSLDPSSFKIAFPFFVPNPWGMSIFLTMPFFFLAFKRPKNLEEWGLITTILVMLVFLLSYYMPGFRQYSARLINDLLPYWFVLLILGRRGKVLTNGEKLFIFGSVMINLYLFSIFKWLPSKEFFESLQWRPL